MRRSAPTRVIGELTFLEVSKHLSETSILCLPIGAIEQHGPHLPLNTDVVVAEEFTSRMIDRWGDDFDLWQLPTLTVSLSREHDWAPGTLSLSIQTFTALLRDMGREVVRSLPARNLVVVNGHGGNRGILEALARELRGDFGLNLCILHPAVLWQAGANLPIADIHGGVSETSLMLALAPHLVRGELIAELKVSAADEAVQALIIDQATTWPWSSDDPRLADRGVIGDPQAASAERGQALIEIAIEKARAVFEELLKNQILLRDSHG